MSEKVTYKTLNSANVRADNSEDTERTYDIAANANIDGMGAGMGMGNPNTVNSIDSGEVKRKSDNVTIATFSSHGYGNLSINHQNTEVEEQCAVTTAVNAFINDLKEKVSNASPLSL